MAASDSAVKRRASVLPLEALNPYTSSWTIRVRASAKGSLRTVKTSRGDSKVFSVELTDEQVSAQPRMLRIGGWRSGCTLLQRLRRGGCGVLVCPALAI